MNKEDAACTQVEEREIEYANKFINHELGEILRKKVTGITIKDNKVWRPVAYFGYGGWRKLSEEVTFKFIAKE